MSILDRGEVTRQVGLYVNFPEHRPAVIDYFLGGLGELIDDEIAHEKLSMLPHERRAEASWAAIQAISCWDPSQFFEDNFRYFLRKSLRLLKPRRDSVCIEGLSIEDPNGDPESIYIVKEQLELLKEFLGKHYDPLTVDQFLRKFADGETFDEIARDYCVKTSGMHQKLSAIMKRVSKYMKRINNG